MTKVKTKTYTYDGDVLSVKESDAWNVHAHPKRGIVINHQNEDGTTYEETRINARKLAELGFFEFSKDA